MLTPHDSTGNPLSQSTIDQIEARLREQLRPEPKSHQQKQSRYARQLFTGRLSWHTHNEELLLDGQVTDIGTLGELLSAEYDFEVNNSKLEPVVLELARANTFNPVLTYLDTCKELHPQPSQDVWNKLYRAMSLQNDLEKAYVKNFCIAAVARAKNPGCKVDTSLILKSPQGYKKTTFFETLFTSELFSTVGECSQEKDELMVLYRNWCVEYGEFESVQTRKGVDNLKRFMSTQVDNYRTPYDRTPRTRQRHFVLCGSTNRDDLLTDPTGSRRFWVITLTKPIDLEAVEQIREEVWAAAQQLYDNKAMWWLTDEQQAESDVANIEYTSEDTWTPAVSHWLNTNKITQTSTTELLSIALEKPVASSTGLDAKRMAAVMQKLGWVQKRVRVDGKQPRMWVEETPTLAGEVTDSVF